MTGEIEMLAVELDGKDGLIVTFSDGTTGGYVIEELLMLRPVRERVNQKEIPSESAISPGNLVQISLDSMSRHDTQ